jgi:hypothetical protein
MLPSVSVPPAEVRERRALVAHRQRLVKMRTQIRTDCEPCSSGAISLRLRRKSSEPANDRGGTAWTYPPQRSFAFGRISRSWTFSTATHQRRRGGTGSQSNLPPWDEHAPFLMQWLRLDARPFSPRPPPLVAQPCSVASSTPFGLFAPVDWRVAHNHLRWRAPGYVQGNRPNPAVEVPRRQPRPYAAAAPGPSGGLILGSAPGLGSRALAHQHKQLHRARDSDSRQHSSRGWDSLPGRAQPADGNPVLRSREATTATKRRQRCAQTKPHSSRRCNSFPAKAQPASRNQFLRRARQRPRRSVEASDRQAVTKVK